MDKREEAIYQIYFHIVNLRDPQKGTESTDCLDQNELIVTDNIVDVENHSLHQCFKMFSNEAVSILHHVGGSDWWAAQTIKICGLETNNK